MAEAALRHCVFTGLVLLISPKPVCVLWKHANLPGWLHWPQAIDYTLSLEHRRWPIFASRHCSFPSPQPAPFIPSSVFCCEDNRLWFLLQLLETELDLFSRWVRSEYNTFHLASTWGVYIFCFKWQNNCWRKEICCCYVTTLLRCLISLCFMLTSACHNCYTEIEDCGVTLYTASVWH